MGSLERLAKRFNGNEFNIIVISTDDYRDAAFGFIKSTRINFENFIDRKLELEHMLGANTIPLTLLVDADGQILQKARGAYEWDSPQTINAIADVFNLKLTQANSDIEEPVGLRINLLWKSHFGQISRSNSLNRTTIRLI
jgi:hypothetical protein